MKIYSSLIEVESGVDIALHNLMPSIYDVVRDSSIKNGFVTVTSQHTTTAISINEYEPCLMDDMKVFLTQLIPPKMLNNQALEALFSDDESDHVERKPSLKQRREIQKNVCAFANDLSDSGQVGVIFIGIEDNGSCSNLTITDEFLRNLSDLFTDGKILPTPVIRVQKLTFRSCEVAVVEVKPADNPPVRFRGTVWVRVGPRLKPASAEEE